MLQSAASAETTYLDSSLIFFFFLFLFSRCHPHDVPLGCVGTAVPVDASPSPGPPRHAERRRPAGQIQWRRTWLESAKPNSKSQSVSGRLAGIAGAAGREVTFSWLVGYSSDLANVCFFPRGAECFCLCPNDGDGRVETGVWKILPLVSDRKWQILSIETSKFAFILNLLTSACQRGRSNPLKSRLWNDVFIYQGRLIELLLKAPSGCREISAGVLFWVAHKSKAIACNVISW